MKRLKRISIGIFLLSTALMIAFNLYERTITDTKPPVVTCPEEVLEVSVDSSEKKLLKGVKAEDKRAGDVSDKVVIEKIGAMAEDGTRKITYAAADPSGNVGRAERTLKYTDYKLPEFSFQDSLRFPASEMNLDLAQNITARSVLDGDITENVKYQILDVQYQGVVGKYQVEIRVTDSVGNTKTLNTIYELYDAEKENIDVELNQYLLYLHVNDEFDPAAYFKEASIEVDPKIESSVDTKTPGVYYVEYTVEKDKMLGKNRLTVVVE